MYIIVSLWGNCHLRGFKRRLQKELLDPTKNSKGQSDWVDFNLPGFNLHLNFHDIRNYGPTNDYAPPS